MLDILISFFKFLLNLYDSMSQEQKDKIKDAVVRSFEELFRSFFDEAGGAV
jgi:hypothetical protein